MILLDTNVLSEFMRPKPAPAVVAWLDSQPAARIWISTISRAEIQLGLHLMPQGQRQIALAQAADAMFEQEFAGRCLPFDATAADHYGRLVAERTQIGRPISVEDAQIAAVALAHQMRLATRNGGDFEHIANLQLINPWTGAGL